MWQAVHSTPCREVAHATYRCDILSSDASLVDVGFVGIFRQQLGIWTCQETKQHAPGVSAQAGGSCTSMSKWGSCSPGLEGLSRQEKPEDLRASKDAYLLCHGTPGTEGLLHQTSLE